jgi:GWxTD domain-containing protein
MKKLIFLIILFAVSNLSWALVPPGDEIRMFLDFARFRYDENNTYLEIYYLLYPEKMENLEEECWFDFSLFDVKNDTMVASSVIPCHFELNVAADDIMANAKSGLIKRVLPEGQYRLQMAHLDQSKSVKLDSISHTFKAPHFPTDKIAISDIELCSKIVTRSKDTESTFYKNTMEVYPNPTRMFGKGSPVLFYYVELYNIKSDNPDDKLSIEVAIADTEGKIRAKKNYARKRNNPSLVELGQFMVSKLEDGVYTLVLAATDTSNDIAVYNRANFYITNPDVIVADESDVRFQFLKEQFDNMSELELDAKFAPVAYITTSREQNVYKNLASVQAKRNFLYSFWKEREKVKEGAMADFYQRVDEANEKYRYSNVPGWESERGRVYIVYGEPDRIERRPYNPYERPFELWHYIDLEGGSQFLFMDESGFGDYKLKSSSVRGEIYDPEYDNYLRGFEMEQ